MAAVIQVLLEASVAAEDVSVAEVWEAIERVVSRGQVAAALAAVCELGPPPDEEADEAWRAELLKRHATTRPFLPILTEIIEFGAVEGGQLVIEAVQRLPELLGRKKVRGDEITAGLVTGSWRRLVYVNPNGEPGLVDHKAYAFCVLDHQLGSATLQRSVQVLRHHGPYREIARWAEGVSVG
ncbi:MAG: hypothetical protein DLM67_25160 [Candidatus Nephthysia bennettiae]|nr:MAG: hypothetical protein DLM67_25160 [Candidatus Dormibacteraeota bacterium]